MDSNKDEALRCINIAKEAISAGNKQRALKFLGIARRLNQNLPVDDLLAACENLDSSSSAGPSDDVKNVIEEIRKAYRKLSLKVHPDKNKAPGAEEAFKKVSKAFKCLSDDDSRRQYDQTGLVDEFEYNQQYQVRRRRRRTGNDFFDDDFDPDEIFRAFFGNRDMFRNAHVYRTRTHNAGAHQREDLGGGGPNLMLLLQLLPFLIIILLAYIPFSEPEYSLQKNYSYPFKKTTEKHGVEFFVKSREFDENYPIGSPSRNDIENM
ncbi:UNVERIFIED_CONTAM: Chaperone protein dnaJ 49 [Sesamum radiatum]|uniref:Chaperone protein dnaJ 49 n=1 Tax=Sesamum radiatum TaxID=300843 RepID=A0AAW2UGX7_SESRA